MPRRYYVRADNTIRGALDAVGGVVYVVCNWAVGEPFRSMVCWGEDSEPYRTRMPLPRLASSFAFTRAFLLTSRPRRHIVPPVRQGPPPGRRPGFTTPAWLHPRERRPRSPAPKESGLETQEVRAPPPRLIRDSPPLPVLIIK